MSKKRPKEQTVSQFGGVETIGAVKAEAEFDGQTKEVGYDVQGIETESKTHLEDDVGYGGAAIVRMFEFGINPQAFKEYQPTKQELFNSHYKGIEMALWRDGMKVIPEVHPRIVIDQEKGSYRIFVGAAPMRGHILQERPKTLGELVHGGKPNSQGK